jgi:hypothetical protein
MDITDARVLTSALDGTGFVLMEHRSAVADFQDRQAVDAIYRRLNLL